MGGCVYVETVQIVSFDRFHSFFKTIIFDI